MSFIDGKQKKVVQMPQMVVGLRRATNGATSLNSKVKSKVSSMNCNAKNGLKKVLR